MPIALRADFNAAKVRQEAKRSRDAAQARRLLALAAIYDGASRIEAAATGSVTVQIVRDWVVKFNTQGPAGLIDRKPLGQPSRLTGAHRAALVQAIEDGPIPGVHGVVRWRLIDLCQWLWDTFEVRIAKPTLSREMRALGYRKLTARLRHHAHAEGAVDALKSFAARLAALARKLGIDPADIEVWFGDQARVGQKNKITRRWARRGSRPTAPHDQRTASTYIFGAICPKEGEAAGLILPWCNIAMMRLFLIELSARVAPGRHALLLLDQAGQHISERLEVPANITIIALPPKCPELNPQENVWKFMRDNWLSNRVFTSYDNVVDHCADAWNKLVAQPWRIMTLGLRDWAQQF